MQRMEKNTPPTGERETKARDSRQRKNRKYQNLALCVHQLVEVESDRDVRMGLLLCMCERLCKVYSVYIVY